MVRLDGGLFFATAEALDERIRALAQDADPPLRAVLLDMESVDFVDSQGAATLAEILDFTESAGVRLQPGAREARRGERARERRRPASASARTASTGASPSRSRQSSPRIAASARRPAG